MTDLEKLLSLIEGKANYRIQDFLAKRFVGDFYVTPAALQQILNTHPDAGYLVESWGNGPYDDDCTGADWLFDNQGRLLSINFFGQN